jgi:hypothetical protein
MEKKFEREQGCRLIGLCAEYLLPHKYIERREAVVRAARKEEGLDVEFGVMCVPRLTFPAFSTLSFSLLLSRN